MRQARNLAEYKVIHLMLLTLASPSPLHSLICEEEREETEGRGRVTGKLEGRMGDKETGKWLGDEWVIGVGR